MLQGLTGLQEVTGGTKGLQGFTKGYKGGVTRGYKGLQRVAGVTGVYKGLRGKG